MSKRQDDPDVPDMDEGMTTAERRRRRRRGAGLRVPSDNVPRRTQPQPIAPVPEDPSLAVSIAYSFSEDGSSPSESAVVRSSSDATFAEAEAEAAKLMATDAPVARGGVPMTAAAAAAAAATQAQLDAVAPDGHGDAKTREMPAVQLEALGLEVPAFLSAQDDHEGERTVVADLEEMRRPPEPPPPEETSAVVQAAPAETSDGVATRSGRAGTVALSEDDLEELKEEVGADGRRRLATAKLAPFEEYSSPSLPVVRFRAPSEPMGPVPTAMPGDSVDIEIEAGADDVKATPEEVALDDDDLQDEVATPGDASDSGEILTDELIEEVEAQSAPAVPLKVEAPEPVAAPAPAPASSSGAPVAAPEPAKTPPAPPAAPAVAKTPPAPPPAPPKKPTVAPARVIAAAVAPERGDRGGDDKKRRAKPWFEEIFDEDYLRTLPFLTPQATQGEAQFVIETLGLQPGAQVLDLGCGYGRHAMELAARGYHVVGLDASLPLLLRGADEAQRRGLTINFVHGDMRELDFDSQFDGAYCIFSTFGFFDDETNKKTAINLGRALKPGARVVLDILNRDYLIADLPTRVWWEGDGCVVLEEVEFNYFSSRIQCNRSVVFDDGRQVEQEISMRAYSLHEIGKLLHAAGFRVLEISGSMVTRGRFFGSTSRQIIVVAERRPKDAAGTASSGKDATDGKLP